LRDSSLTAWSPKTASSSFCPTTAVPPAMWGHKEEPLYHYDRAEAMKLLAEAHYKQPPQRPKLYVMDTARDYMPEPETVARIIQHNLRDVGIDIEVVVNDFDTQVRLTQEGVHDLCLLGWSADSIDPDNFLYVLFDPENAEPGTARNLAFFKNAELHGILSWAQESSDRAERVRFYAKAQDLIAREAPWVPLAHSEVVVAARTSLHGLQLHPSGTVYFQTVHR
jgi:peptide/nickel transport system substrate-binding protein